MLHSGFEGDTTICLKVTNLAIQMYISSFFLMRLCCS